MTLEALCIATGAHGHAVRLELLVLEEKRRWIEEGPFHLGESAVVQAVGLKPVKGGGQTQG
jgi:hypothetical protein